MSSWAGFTDEELSRLRQQNVPEGDTSCGGRKKATINSAKRQRPREKIRSRTPSADVKPSLDGRKENAEEKSSTLGRNRTASDSNEKAARQIETRDEERENSSPECERRVYKKKEIPEEAPPQRKDVQKTDNFQESKGTEVDYVAEKDAINDLPEIIDESDRIQAIELSAWEKMQEKQKQIEQENKRKKAALQETIKKRYQKTQAEAQTLSLVQKELSHLDNLLSADVAILRDKIEESSREYLQAQKRYEKAEHEFVEAKMDLHRKTERKDLLTEHLYTIIRENELRKARKLEELMAKLNVSPDHIPLVQQTDFLEVGNDESRTKQDSAEISVLQEEKASVPKQGMDSESKDSCQVTSREGTTTSMENTDGNTRRDSGNDGLEESDDTVTS